MIKTRSRRDQDAIKTLCVCLKCLMAGIFGLMIVLWQAEWAHGTAHERGRGEDADTHWVKHEIHKIPRSRPSEI